ncbi:MAG TPA: beta-ketoacyl synthase chain length factor [Rhodocyclaceae bacterium]
MIEKTSASWELPLAAWAEWRWSEDYELPKLDFVDPMLRRRLSELSKISLWTAHQCVQGLNAVRMIYASQHGEIVRTTEMLGELADNHPLSPTAFSMSVLNASIGLYSIIRGNTEPATAIAAGAETLGYALLEAYGQLSRNPTQPVLVIYADETVPTVWQSQNMHPPHALALLFQNDATMRVRCTRVSGGDLTNTANTQARTLVDCLSSGDDVSWNQSGKSWHWQRLAE